MVITARGSVSCAEERRQGIMPGRLFGEMVRVIA